MRVCGRAAAGRRLNLGAKLEAMGLDVAGGAEVDAKWRWVSDEDVGRRRGFRWNFWVNLFDGKNNDDGVEVIVGKLECTKSGPGLWLGLFSGVAVRG